MLALLALVANGVLLFVALTDSKPDIPDADSILAWLAPLATPMAQIAIVVVFLSLLTERLGDAFPKHARVAVLLGVLALACGAAAIAFG